MVLIPRPSDRLVNPPSTNAKIGGHPFDGISRIVPAGIPAFQFDALLGGEYGSAIQRSTQRRPRNLSASLLGHVGHIVFERTKKKMARVEAKAVVAVVADVEIARLCVICDPVHDAVGAQTTTLAVCVVPDRAVAAGYATASPRPAFIVTEYVYALQKSLQDLEWKWRYRDRCDEAHARHGSILYEVM